MRYTIIALALAALSLTACTKNDDTPAEPQRAQAKKVDQTRPAVREAAPRTQTVKPTVTKQTRKAEGNHDARVESAIEIVKSRGVSRYVKAAEMLKTIPKSSSRYAEAQAYLEWIEADGMVRTATRAYHRGQVRRAFSLLKQASTFKALGPSAHASIKQRRLLWGRVIRSTQRGERLIAEGKRKEAAIHLRYVVKLERNRRNAFRSKASRLLRKIG